MKDNPQTDNQPLHYNSQASPSHAEIAQDTALPLESVLRTEDIRQSRSKSGRFWIAMLVATCVFATISWFFRTEIKRFVSGPTEAGATLPAASDHDRVLKPLVRTRLVTRRQNSSEKFRK